MSEAIISGNDTGWVNSSGVDDATVLPAIRDIAAVLQTWSGQAVVNDNPMASRDSGTGLFSRQKYNVSDDPYAQFALARAAVRDDDVVGGVAEVTEGLMFEGIKFESEDLDEADVFNQIAKDIDLDSVVRQMYRELFTYSQVVVASLWRTKTYTVRGRTIPENPDGDPTEKPSKVKGRKRRKTYTLTVPHKLIILDSTKVIPLQPSVLGEERLCWNATPSEVNSWEAGTDEVMTTLFTGRARLSKNDIASLPPSVNPGNLMALNPVYVFRHTATKPTYARWADVRMRSVFRMLDLKQQLMDADRAALAGNARYLILVRKGSKEQPGTSNEIANLKENFDVIAKLPVIVSDHRLEIEIVAPKMDLTLQAAKYDTVDRRILSRLLGALSASSTGQRNESTLTVARMVGRLLESKRHMIKRALEANIVRNIMKFNEGVIVEAPSLTYFPARVELDTDPQMVQAIVGARARNELSRESFLEFIGYDQATELQRRLQEKLSGADDIFQTFVPFDSPENNPNSPNNPARNNGGSNPGNNTGANGGGRPPGGGQPNQNATAPGKAADR